MSQNYCVKLSREKRSNNNKYGKMLDSKIFFILLRVCLIMLTIRIQARTIAVSINADEYIRIHAARLRNNICMLMSVCVYVR